jgi:hypothetical protein
MVWLPTISPNRPSSYGRLAISVIVCRPRNTEGQTLFFCDDMYMRNNKWSVRVSPVYEQTLRRAYRQLYLSGCHCIAYRCPLGTRGPCTAVPAQKYRAQKFCVRNEVQLSNLRDCQGHHFICKFGQQPLCIRRLWGWYFG